jgi:HIV Tat-specific factor 1
LELWLTDRQLEWFDDRPALQTKSLQTVILKHMFTLEQLNADPTLLLDLKQDVRGECENFGPVTNVILYDVLLCFYS